MMKSVTASLTKLMACSAFVCVSTQLTAGLQGRIDVHPVGKKEIALQLEKKNKGGWLSHIGWGKLENRKYSLTFNISKVTPKWQNVEFSFIPGKSGKVSLFLLSNQVKGENRWVEYDNLKVTGAKVVNPDFEKLDKSGKKAEGWSSRGKGYIIITDAKGNHCVKVFHNQPAIQTIEVTAGKKVTVSCMIKLPELEKKKLNH